MDNKKNMFNEGNYIQGQEVTPETTHEGRGFQGQTHAAAMESLQLREERHGCKCSPRLPGKQLGMQIFAHVIQWIPCCGAGPAPEFQID